MPKRPGIIDWRILTIVRAKSGWQAECTWCDSTLNLGSRPISDGHGKGSEGA